MTFYEELDAYLGPWGPNGYPIGYGKFYCMAFNGNPKLQHNADTREWVRKTTIALQEPLRDFVVIRFQAHTLARVTEPDLRQVAFDVHPLAYTQGGLDLVVLIAPEMLPIIASIPAAEFNPGSANFSSSVKQVFATLALVVPQAAGNVMAAAAGPAHNGSFRRAVELDRLRFQQELNTGRWLGQTLEVVNSGQMDDIRLLNHLTAKLNETQFGDQGLAALARQVVVAANARKHYIANYYRQQIQAVPGMRAPIDANAPGWSNW